MASLRRRLPALLALVALCAGGLFAAYAWSTGRQTAAVELPGDDASPEQVVSTLISALNHHDCETAVSLTTARGSDSVERWCGRVRSLAAIKIGTPRDEKPEWSGSPATSQVVRVPVEFEVTWRPFTADGSIPNGPLWWGYILRRDHPEDPWRVLDQGMG